MTQPTQFDHTWYTPGDWAFPQWWTHGVTMRVGYTPTTADQTYFMTSAFVRNVLGHAGGMTTPPATTRRA